MCIGVGEEGVIWSSMTWDGAGGGSGATREGGVSLTVLPEGDPLLLLPDRGLDCEGRVGEEVELVVASERVESDPTKDDMR